MSDCTCGFHESLAAKDAEIAFWKDRMAEHAQMYLDVEAKLEQAEATLRRVANTVSGAEIADAYFAGRER